MSSKMHSLLFATLCLVVAGSNVYAAPNPIVDCRLIRCAAPTCDNPIPADPSVGRCCPVCLDLGVCPPEKPLVFCIINPCQFALCPALPGTVCVPDYCGGCFARFYDVMTGNEVTEKCECPVKGQKFTQCGSPCVANCTNPSPFCTEPCVPRCQCPPGEVINEAINQCVPVDQCPSLTVAPPTCPPDKPLVHCLVDPCQVTRCQAHPDAKCVADYCGGCNARFYNQQGIEVTDSCVTVALAVAPSCPPGKPPVQCTINPCQFVTCPAHPYAVCEPDYCGGCNARFYDGAGNEVTDDCGVQIG